MEKVQLDDLELAEFWQEDNEEMKVAANFPYTPSFPANAGLEADNHTVVYGEIDSGKELATHTEDGDELLVILGGTAEVTIGENDETLTDGELILIPAEEPHRVRSVGDETVRYLGVFAASEVTSEFKSALQPVGSRIV
jgi:quercetin dioxygenase-like cupin family protein